MFRQLVRYGVPAFAASTAMLVMNQSAPILIGHFHPVALVGYFALPSRILQNVVDAIGRVGLVTRSRTASLEAAQRDEEVRDLSVYANRYCFTLFAPVAIFLLIYGRELITLWMTPEYAQRSALVLPIMVPATTDAAP